MTKDRARAKAAQYIEWAIKAEAKSNEIYENWSKVYKDFDWTQPILRGHHSQRAHEKIYERRDSMHRTIRDLDAKAKRFREKADNLTRFANTNKGDAQKKRDAKIEGLKAVLIVGSKVTCPLFNGKVFEVVKLNAKTARIKCNEWVTLQPINFLSIYE